MKKKYPLKKQVFNENNYRRVGLWTGAIFVGLFAVLYAKLTEFVQSFFLSSFAVSPQLVTALSPIAFVLAVMLVRKFSPEAKGSGIPQVLEAIERGQKAENADLAWRFRLVSIRAAVFKILSSTIGILGGASIGREGPTVQIAASTFAAVGRKFRAYAPHIEFPSFLTAGAAAGVAAAFNTPLAGITFAVEELIINGSLTHFRRTMMISVIFSGITAQALLGNYLYFGRPALSATDSSIFILSILIGIVAGGLGGIFARTLAFPKISKLPEDWFLRALLCGIACALLGYWTNGATAGSGYEATAAVLNASSVESADIFFPIYKLITTVLSYLSGMAGGIFSPSLSIGAGVGVSLAKIFQFADFKACALIGMVGFFSGVVQAPITAVIIVTEMTDRHILIIPFLIAAFIGHGTGRLFMPIPLYHFLAKQNQKK